MPHLDSNIPSNIYYVSISSGILRFAGNTSDINAFATVSIRHLKRMHRQGNKYRSIMSM